MNKKKSGLAFTATVILALPGLANATLIDRGGGLIYDTALNVTWMQDAQYSITSGYNAFGRMNWQAANDWAAGMQYYDSVRNVVWDDWRLPTTVNSASSLGYDLTGQTSELAFMYYANLGYAPNYAHDRFAPAPSSSNYNPFVNLAYRGYWSGTAADWSGSAWMLHFHFGSQEVNGMGDEQRVWLLRDGDVTVPEPETLGLLGAGLLALEISRRLRNRAG
jgi:hypothetical protein